jgi:hypothetical protein
MLSRRSILRGASLGAGSMALSPFVRHLEMLDREPLHRQLPRRFVFVVKGSGLQGDFLEPGGLSRKTDQLIDEGLAGKELPESLVPLEPFRDRLTILQGLSGKMCTIGHSSFYGALGAYKATGQTPPTGPTIDGFLSEKFPSVFNHVGLKMGAGGQGTAYPSISAIGKNRQLAFQCNPQLAYMNLFGSIVDKGDIAKKYQRSGSVLDFMSDDIKKLRSRLPGPEKEKLEHYLNGFETLKNRRRKLVAMQDQLKANAPRLNDKYTSKVSTHHLDAHFDMATAALITGITNVVTLHCDDLQSSYEGLGITPTVHSIGHGSSNGAETAQECRDRIRTFHVQLIAGMAERLAEVPEGDGTMLDNTVIVYLSDNSNLHHSTAIEWPMVVLGNLGGKLKTSGRYLAYPRYGKRGNRTIGNWLTTVCHAAGLPQDHFGQPDLALSKEIDQLGPLPELLA